MLFASLYLAQGFVAEEGRSQGHRNCRILTKERKPDKRADKHKRQQTKEQGKGKQKARKFTHKVD